MRLKGHSMTAWKLALALALAVLTSPATAQDKTGPNLATRGGGAQGGVAQLAFAHRLFVLGLAEKDAMAVLAAARLARDVTVTAVDRPKQTQQLEGLATVDGGAGVIGPVSPDAMLDAARKLAGNDETMLGQIDAALGIEPDPGTTAGRTVSQLAAGQADIWQLAVFGGVLAEVAVIGDGDGNLNLGIADENGVTICRNSGPGDLAHCDWVPAWNGYFTVTVSNLGTTQNNYHLLTN